MILLIDNFLNNTFFKYLQLQINNSINHHNLNIVGQWMQNKISHSGKISEFKNLGPVVTAIIDQTKTSIEKEIKSEIAVRSYRLQATNHNFIIHPHLDGDIKNAGRENCFTSLLYLHDFWDMRNGGLFATTDIEIEPVPNRLIVYSRDILHGVTAANNVWTDPRKLLLMSWHKNK